MNQVRAAPPAPPTTRCANCGHEQVEAYCSRCGQRTRRSRFELRPLLRQAADDAFNLDRGLLHTIVALSREPGRAISEYVRGRTRPYTHPAKYLVIWAALATIALMYSGLWDAQMELIPDSPDPQVDEAARTFMDFMARYFNILLILGVPFVAVFSFLFFRRAGYNFAEHLIFNVFVYAHQNAIFIATLPVFFLASMGIYLAVWTLVMALYYVWACRGFFGVSRAAATVRGLLVVLCGYILTWALGGAALSFLVTALG